ncbi:MAG: prepilin peptidase [bacterium]|nr:prepilin peptidase [bacterium]
MTEAGAIPSLPPANFFDPYYHAFHVPFVFVLGTIFGSFFNVCIYRIPMGVPLSMPRSHCYRCGRAVRWHDNIPLLSYWILRGRCRHCGARFSIRYFGVELLTGLLFSLVFARVGYSLALIPALVFISLLVIATFTDIDHWIIPDRISLGGLGAGLLLAAVWPIAQAPGNPLVGGILGPELFRDVPGRWRPLADAVAAAAIGFGALWSIGWLGSIIFGKEAMGVGDMKLFAMFGAFCGLENLVYILLLACVIGTVVGLGLIARDRIWHGRPVPAALASYGGDPAAAEALAAVHPLGAEEQQVVLAALTAPGVVGPLRHHLTFGPPLAVAGCIVYLFGPRLAAWFETIMFGLDRLG